MRATTRGESALLLIDVLDVLRAKSVKYAVIGAMAAAVHGVVRASVDADAIVSLAALEAPALSKALADAGFNVELKMGSYDDPIAAVLIIKDKHKNRVDLLFGLKGFDREAFDRVLQIEMSGESLQVVSREDFIAMKLFAGGPVDVRDAQQAYYVNKEVLDIALLRTVARQFSRDASKALESIIAEFGAQMPSP
jgi:predicted nucleotidyltransferase